MSYDTNTSVHSRVISAFFDTSVAAQKAVDDLVAAGIPRQHISQINGHSGAAGADDGKGFWDSLKDMFLPEEDRYTYAEGLRRGGFLVTVNADEANYDRVLDILDTEGSVNLDEREGQWRSEGWSGYAAGANLGLASGSTMREASATTAMTPSSIERTSYAVEAPLASAATRPTTSAGPAAGQDETVKLYEENLRVGKRDVNHGRVRLRSYVVETPVTEQVSLRNETVTVDRKAVDRPVSATDALFQDRVIELEEHAEEAVIAKDARVIEEISLRKVTETSVQTVSDTVRRTEVEVQDDRRLAATTTSQVTSRLDASRIVEHMDVISADGQKIGTVDHLDGPDRIKLAKSTSPDGQHHVVPFAWIDHIDQHVHLNRSLADIKFET